MDDVVAKSMVHEVVVKVDLCCVPHAIVAKGHLVARDLAVLLG